ncbi:phosphoserine transaminase [soil metagenome]
MSLPDITVPADLLPVDGRFGCGPSKIRQEAVEALSAAAPALLGTSHRRPAVKDQVRRVREGLDVFFGLPAGYEVLLGNGGATLFWDAAAHHLIERRSAHAVFGEFSTKFARAVAGTPWLEEPVVVESPPGTHPVLEPVEGVDAYALTHCETSTGVAMPVRRPDPGGDALVLVDATSAAGGIAFDPVDADAYYFSPQKCFASEGGLWAALCSPAALDRVAAIAASGRHAPATLDLTVARDNAASDQTYNTPAVATLFLMAEQLDWMNSQGGIAWAAQSCLAKSSHLYGWAQSRDWAAPFVADPAQRSPVVCTVDLDDGVAADIVTGILRRHGVVDIEAYRKLGRNQLRIATFPAIDHADVEALTACVDHVVGRL